MAGVSDKDLVRLGPWPAGVNNLAPEGAMPTDENGNPIALRVADNIDLDRAGWPSTRDGTDRFLDGVLTHSLWSDEQLSFGLFVNDSELCALHEDESVDQLGQAMAAGLPVSYARINDRVYWSNGAQCGLTTLGLACYPWAPAQPGGQPTIAIESGLELDPGRYQVAVTFTDILGRESGSTLAAVVEAEAGSGLRLENIPQPPDPAFSPIVNVYMSGANDNTFKLKERLPAGQVTLIIGSLANGPKLETQFLIPMPPCHIVRHGNGRQWGALGRELIWSPSLRYGLMDPVRGRVRFPDKIDVMEYVGDGTESAGIFVAAGKRTYFLAGTDPLNFKQQQVYASGAVRGTGIVVPGDVFGFDTPAPVAAWLSRNGHFCVGLPGGTVMPLKRQETVVDGADSGAVLFREANGIRQLLAALRAPAAQKMAIGDRAVAHILHDES